MSLDFSCRDCVGRHVGCHSTCEIYKEEKERLNNKREWEKNHKNVIITQGSFTGNATALKTHKKRPEA